MDAKCHNIIKFIVKCCWILYYFYCQELFLYQARYSTQCKHTTLKCHYSTFKANITHELISTIVKFLNQVSVLSINFP